MIIITSLLNRDFNCRNLLIQSLYHPLVLKIFRKERRQFSFYRVGGRTSFVGLFSNGGGCSWIKTITHDLLNAGVCLRTARRPEEAAEHFARALAVRPNHAEAMYQLADLDLERGMLVEARSGLDRFLDTYRPTPELLLLGVRIARAQNDRMAEERYARRLRIEFPDSDQLRELPARRRNPG